MEEDRLHAFYDIPCTYKSMNKFTLSEVFVTLESGAACFHYRVIIYDR